MERTLCRVALGLSRASSEPAALAALAESAELAELAELADRVVDWIFGARRGACRGSGLDLCRLKSGKPGSWQDDCWQSGKV